MILTHTLIELLFVVERGDEQSVDTKVVSVPYGDKVREPSPRPGRGQHRHHTGLRGRYTAEVRIVCTVNLRLRLNIVRKHVSATI